ncbi:MAG TPA: hypothetical protein VHS09_05565 [Polyangiaceae bacterium]|nr:hypothetical protein [Polyangiaceae bacterium]
MQRNILPWVLLGTAVVVTISLLRNPAPVAPAPGSPSASSVVAGGPTPAPPPLPPGPASSAPGPAGRRFDDPPLDDTELREAHMHVGHEICEEGAKRINELEGLNPTDPKGIHIIGTCLQHGNVAWYKCILKAATRMEAGTCNRRFLNSGVGP